MDGPVLYAESVRTPFGIDLAVGAGVVTASAAVAGVLFPHAPARLLVVVLAAGGFAAVVDDPRAGLAVGGLGLLLFDGFLVNRYGELTWDGTTSMWYVIAFALALVVGFGWRWIRLFRADAAVDAGIGDFLNHTVSTTEENSGD